jgi:hypothetical protein
MKFNTVSKRCKMAKKNLERTYGAMKNVLVETIVDLIQVAKKSSNSIFTTILEQGSQNIGDLLDLYGDKLKKKVEKHAETKNEENQSG